MSARLITSILLLAAALVALVLSLYGLFKGRPIVSLVGQAIGFIVAQAALLHLHLL